MSHLERRSNLWYATLTIPKDVREELGKHKFIKSLGTPDKRQASLLAAPIVANWQAQIRQARGEDGAIEREAARWKDMFASSKSDVEADVLEDLLIDKAIQIEQNIGKAESQEFYSIAKGMRTTSNIRYDQWQGQLDVVAKTKDQFIKDVGLLLKRFKSLEAITRQEVKIWTDEITTSGGSANTVNRILIACRSYWRYLQKYDLVSVENEPFKNVHAATKPKSKAKAGWIPFEPSAVVRLWQQALEDKDQVLADLIYIGAYTGARIEEICSLELVNVTNKSLGIRDAKTKAGVRDVPIHSKLEDTISRLRDNSKDGYLLSGLTKNKYDDRSNAVGKRFGRMKTELGFGGSHVFHSIRKTLVTLLENAGVSEGVTADIVGHEKQTMTYGLYSGGNSLEVKKTAIEKVEYIFDANPKLV